MDGEIRFSVNFPLTVENELEEINASGRKITEDLVEQTTAFVRAINAAFFAGKIEKFNENTNPAGGCSYTEFLVMDIGNTIYKAGLNDEPCIWTFNISSGTTQIDEKIKMLAETLNTYFKVQYRKGNFASTLKRENGDAPKP